MSQTERIDLPEETKLVSHRHKHRSNSISNGQIHNLSVPKIEVSLVPEVRSPAKNSSKSSCFPTIDEESDHNHPLHHSLSLHPDNNNDYKNHQSLKFIRKRSNSISNGQIGKVTTSSTQFFTEGRRRISQVGSVVSQSLQTTIGWKSIANEKEIANQAKCLCAKYVRFKLRKSGLIHKRLQLQRLRSVGNMNDDTDQNLNRVALELKTIIQELERTHPKVFSSVASNTGDAPLKSVASVIRVHSLIGQFIFSGDISWSHIAAFYAVTGALAMDYVRAGHPEFVLPLIESLAEFIRVNIASWISQEGGWVCCSFSITILLSVILF